MVFSLIYQAQGKTMYYKNLCNQKEKIRHKLYELMTPGRNTVYIYCLYLILYIKYWFLINQIQFSHCNMPNTAIFFSVTLTVKINLIKYYKSNIFV